MVLITKAIRTRTRNCLVIAGLFVFSVSAQAAAYPSSVILDIERDDGLTETVVVTVDGQRLENRNFQYIEDLDGDRRPELIIKGLGSDDSPICRTLYVVPSTLSQQRQFSSAELNSWVRYEGFKTFFDSGCLPELTRGVIPLGDVNGDGIGDLFYESLTDEDASTGFILYGNATAGAVINLQVANSSTHVSAFEYLARAGDLDADGLADVFFGAYDPGVIRGSALTRDVFKRSDFDAEDFIVSIVPDSGQYFFDIEPAGDVNGDGVDDALFMTWNRTGYFVVEGALGLQLDIIGDDDLIARDIVDICEGNVYCNIGPVGDFDGDGVDDLASYYGVLYGSADGVPLAVDNPDLDSGYFTRFTGGLPFNSAVGTNRSENKIRSIGDINQDGAEDLVFLNNTFVILNGVLGERVARYDTGLLDGSNGFIVSYIYRTELDPAAPLVIADYDADGVDDLMFHSRVVLRGQVDTGKPPAPAEVRARFGFNSTDVLWSAPVDSENVAGYEVSLDGSVVGSVSADVFQLTVDDVATVATNSNPPVYSVSTLGVDDRKSVAVDRYFTFGPVGPGYPPFTADSYYVRDNERPIRGLNVAVYGSNIVELLWDETPSRFLIFRDNQFIAAVDGNSFIDTGLEEGRDYTWFVTRGQGPAVDATDITRPRTYDCLVPCRPLLSSFMSLGRSDRVTTRTTQSQSGSDIATPADLRIDVYSSTDLELFWGRAAEPLTTYDVYRNGELVREGMYGLSVFDTQLQPGVEYEYSVVSFVDGMRSEPASVSVIMPDPSVPVDSTATTPPPQPTGVRAAVYSAYNLEIFWDRAEAPLTTFDVYRDNELIREAMYGLSVFDTQLIPGTRYEYTIVAKLGDVASSPVVFSVSTEALSGN